MNEERVYSKEDVEALAEAVLESWYDPSDSSFACYFCTATHHNKKADGTIEHRQDCVTLVAQDVLTP